MTEAPTNPWHHDAVERRFVDTPYGQFHARLGRATPAADDLPLLMLHPSPASSISLVPLLCAMAPYRRVIALDTMGFGDSAAPPIANPQAADYAGWAVHAADALGMEQFDLYGSHTGAHIATEMAIAQPNRVRRVILDGVALFDAELKSNLLANYAPPQVPDMIGSQFNWAWHFIRDQSIYFPYYQRKADQLRHQDMQGAQRLHVATVEVLKALETYHLGYQAAFSHADHERLPLMTQTTLLTASASDPLRGNASLAASLVPDSRLWLSPASSESDALAAKVVGLNQFLTDGSVP